MNTLLWIIQALLALVFLMTGLMKVLRPKEQLITRMGGLEGYSQSAIRMIGIAEILGAVGLILPSLTGVFPWLTPLAAAGLVLLMIGASLTHYRRKEYSGIGLTSVLLLLALLVTVGRFWILPL